jgi:hypothetical protein
VQKSYYHLFDFARVISFSCIFFLSVEPFLVSLVFDKYTFLHLSFKHSSKFTQFILFKYTDCQKKILLYTVKMMYKNHYTSTIANIFLRKHEHHKLFFSSIKKKFYFPKVKRMIFKSLYTNIIETSK